MSLDSLERSSTEMQRGDSTTEGQEEERQRLKMKKKTLDAQLQDGRVLSVEVRERQKCTLVCHLGFAPNLASFL